MKKNVLCLALGLVLSVTVVAENRQAIANLPSNTPTVTLTLDGKARQVQPTKVIVKEKSESSIDCIVKAGKDKAQVTLPISYDLFVTFCYRSAGLAHSLGIITDAQKAECDKWYNDQINR